jgi:hypothetical protein
LARTAGAAYDGAISYRWRVGEVEITRVLEFELVGPNTLTGAEIAAI